MPIRALLARMFEAWERGDGEAYAACFTEDCDYITFNGIHLRGRAENFRLHSALFRTVLRGSQLSADIESIEHLAPGVALMHTAGRGRKKSFQTYVLTKVDGHWLIKSFQNDDAPDARSAIDIELQCDPDLLRIPSTRVLR